MDTWDGWPPGRRIAVERRARVWDAEDVACRMVRLSVFLGEPDLEITAAMVTAWEIGVPIPAERLPLLSAVLDLPIDLLMGALDGGSLSPWTVLVKRPSTIDDDMLRREFIGLVTLMAAAPLVDGERLVSALGHYTHVDHELLGQLRRSVRMYASQYDRMPVELFRERAHATLEALKALLAGKMPPSTRRDCMSIAAEAAVLAGWASRCSGRVDEARATYSVANTLARAADDRHVWALEKARTADLHSAVQAGGAAVADAKRVRPLLDSAEDLADPSAPPALRAHIMLRQAEEHAAAGEVAEAARYVDRADTALSIGGSFADGLYGIGWDLAVHDAYRGNVALLSGQPAVALSILEATLRRMDESTVSNRSSVLADMAAAHAVGDDLDRACELLRDAFHVAHRAGLEHRTRRVTGIRERHLERWADTPQVWRLDEELASA